MRSRLLMIALVALLCVVAAQGYYIYRLTQGQSRLSTVDPLLPPRPPAASPRWDPYEELRRMQEEMNNIFGSSLSRLHLDPEFAVPFSDRISSPPVDIRDTGSGWEIKLDIPGAVEQDIEVTLNGQILHISARTHNEQSRQHQGIVRQERFIGQFQRSLTLPGPVKPGSLRTRYEDGVLLIRVERG